MSNPKSETQVQSLMPSKPEKPRGFLAMMAAEFGQALSDAVAQVGKAITETAAETGAKIEKASVETGQAVAETAANVGGLISSVSPTGLTPLSKTVTNLGSAIGATTAWAGQAVAQTVNQAGKELGMATCQQASPAVAQMFTELGETISSASPQTKLQEFGGSLLGATAGEVVGGTVGGLAAGIVLGPAGAVIGTQVGSMVGLTIGTQLGEDVVRIQLQKPAKEVSSGAKILDLAPEQVEGDFTVPKQGSWLVDTPHG